MTLGDINTKITFLTGADTTAAGFPTADRVISLNNYKNRVVTAILRSEDEIDFDDNTITTTYPMGTRNLVANQQDYKFSSALWALLGVEGGSAAANAAITPLKIKRVEISYNGTNWYKAEPLDINQYSGDTTQTSINSIFQTSRPYYDVAYNGLFLYPVPTSAVTGGLKIWFDRSATDYTSSDLTTGTIVPPIDIAFQPILAYGPSYEYGISNGKQNTSVLKQELEQLMAEMANYYGDKQKDRVYSLQSNNVTYT